MLCILSSSAALCVFRHFQLTDVIRSVRCIGSPLHTALSLSAASAAISFEERSRTDSAGYCGSTPASTTCSLISDVVASKIQLRQRWTLFQHSCKPLCVLATHATLIQIKYCDAAPRRHFLLLCEDVQQPFSFRMLLELRIVVSTMRVRFVREHNKNMGSGRPSTLDTHISSCLLPHTFLWVCVR
jgi:hypothetical protein